MTNRFPAYRSSYNSRNVDNDSSTHSSRSDPMDLSLHSHQNFLESRDKDLDLESENWLAPMGMCEEEYEEDRGQHNNAQQHLHIDNHGADSQNEGESTSCWTLLSDLLCCLYSESDDLSNSIHLSRPMPPCGSLLHSASRLLSLKMAAELYDFIPEVARLSPPTLLFATYRDGWTMESLLAKTCDKEPVIILIKAAQSQVVLGAYSTAKLAPPSTRVRGNGECFVFRLSSPAAAYRWTYVPSMKKASQNQFVVSCQDYIAFGASQDEAHNAIRLDNDLRICHSGASDTYQNEPLVPEEMPWGDDDNMPKSSPFQVMDIEVLQVQAAGRRRAGRGGGG